MVLSARTVHFFSCFVCVDACLYDLLVQTRHYGYLCQNSPLFQLLCVCGCMYVWPIGPDIMVLSARTVHFFSCFVCVDACLYDLLVQTRHYGYLCQNSPLFQLLCVCGCMYVWPIGPDIMVLSARTVHFFSCFVCVDACLYDLLVQTRHYGYLCQNSPLFQLLCVCGCMYVWPIGPDIMVLSARTVHFFSCFVCVDACLYDLLVQTRHYGYLCQNSPLFQLLCVCGCMYVWPIGPDIMVLCARTVHFFSCFVCVDAYVCMNIYHGCSQMPL